MGRAVPHRSAKPSCCILPKGPSALPRAIQNLMWEAPAGPAKQTMQGSPGHPGVCGPARPLPAHGRSGMLEPRVHIGCCSALNHLLCGR